MELVDPHDVAGSATMARAVLAPDSQMPLHVEQRRHCRGPRPYRYRLVLAGA